MSTFWLIYFVTLGVVVFFTAIIGIFFQVEGECKHFIIPNWNNDTPKKKVLLIQQQTNLE